MMWYYVAFDDDTGCEIQARDKADAMIKARALYPQKTVISSVCCEFLDLPF